MINITQFHPLQSIKTLPLLQQIGLTIVIIILAAILADVYSIWKDTRKEQQRIISIQIENCIKQTGFPIVDWNSINVMCTK